jgi:predicted PurR-regulated permease PerM
MDDGESEIRRQPARASRRTVRGVDRPLAGDAVTARIWSVALLLLVALLLYPFVSGILGAAVLFVLVEPLLRRVTGTHRRRVAAFATMFACFFVLVVPGAWLLGELLAQVPGAVRQLQGSAAVQRLMQMTLGDLAVGTLLHQATADIVSWSSRQTMGVVSGAMHSTLNLVVALFGTYYLLTSHDSLWAQVRARLPIAPALADVLKLRFHRVTEAMVLGVVAACVAQGALVGVAFWALGLPHALLWGAVTAVVSVLPIFGSALVWLPACGVLLASDRPGAALFLLGYGSLLVSNIDNVLRLVVYQRVSQIHPMVTLVGAFAGVKVFGVAGLLLGPLVLSYALELAWIDTRVPVRESLPDPLRRSDSAAPAPVLL